MKFRIISIYLWFLIYSCSSIFINSLQQPRKSETKNPKFITSIIHIPNIKYNLQQSAIVLADNIEQADEIMSNLVLNNDYPKHLIFIIVFMKGNIKELKNIGVDHLTIKSGSIDLYSYFLGPSDNIYTLMSLNWYTKSDCNKNQLLPINMFSQMDGKWMPKLKYQRKFMNLRNCLITLDTDFEDFTGVNLYYGTVTGLIPEFFRIMAVCGNFNTYFQIFYRDGIEDTSNGKFIKPNIYMRLGVYSKYTFGKVHFGSAFLPSDYPFYVTPGELYTSYEKLFLPFDFTTWILILITFVVAFAVIFFVNFSPKWVRKIIYGSNVQTPALNAVQNFFGVSQTQIPVENTPRIILIFFVFFCLVIRTAYQGISFDILTSEMRKKPINSIEELIRQNFTIITPEGSGYAFDEYIISMIGKDEKKQITRKPDLLIAEFYRDNIKNASAKLAFFMQDSFFDSIHSTTNGIQGIYLKEKLFSYPIGFGIFKNHFMSALVESTMQLMIPSGIPQYLFEHHKWLKFGRIHVNKKIGPKVLSIDDLSFGFVLWAVSCGFSAIVFGVEIFGSWLRAVIGRGTGMVAILNILKRGFLLNH